MSTELISGPELFKKLREDWTDLAASSPAATPFQTWHWHFTWWNHFGRGKQARAIVVREGKDLVGLMALVRTTGAWRVLRSMGIGPSDYLHPLFRKGYEDLVASEIAECLRTSGDVDIVDIHQLRQTRAEPLQAKCQKSIDQATCLVLDLPSTYDEYLAMLGKSLRQDVRKLDKKLFLSGSASIEQVPNEDVQAGFEAFLDLHKTRWRERKLPGAFIGRTVRFHREWIEHAAQNGWLDLSLLRLEGQVIGAIYAMKHGDTSFYYQAGFDPTNGTISPGNLLVAHTIRKAIHEGRTHFDFMRGDEPYKRRWKPQHVYVNRRLLIASPGVRGRFGASWNEVGSTLERKVRDRLEGRGLL